jgi:hypothetical protein
MKQIVGWVVAGIIILAAAPVKAQTSTNVDFLTLRLNIALKCITNSEDSSVFGDAGARINSKDIIQLLSGRRSFPLEKIFDGNGTPIPHLAGAVMSNFTSNAKLLILQALGTNHGQVFVVVRDGHPPVDYDVSEYFTFNKRGFDSLGTNQVVRNNGLSSNSGTAALYLEEVTFDNLAAGGGGDRVAFAVDGFAKEKRTSVIVRGEEIDSDAVKSLESDVAGTGDLSNNFAVIRGTISASGATKEAK